MAGEQVMAIWLYVSDLARSMAFYREVLGLPLVMQAEGEARFTLGTVSLWLREQPALSERRPAWGALLLPVLEGLEQRMQGLIARGVAFSAPPEATPLGRVAAFHDPDGHMLCLWEPTNDHQPQMQGARQATASEEARRKQELATLLSRAERAKAGERYAEAARLYRMVLEAEPGYAAAWGSLGYVLNELEEHEEALHACERALHLDPAMPEVWNNRGNALDHLKRHEEALAAYDRATALAPATAAFWVNKGAALTNLGRYDEALAVLDRALALEERHAAAWANRAWALALLERYDEALAAIDRALALGLHVAGALDTKGYTLAGLGRYEEALVCYRRARAQTPDAPDILEHQAAALRALGRRDDREGG